MRGFKTVESFAKTAREAKTPEEAEKIFRGQLDKFLKAKVSPEELKKGAKAVQESDSRKLAKSFQDMDRAIANDFVPVLINDLLPALKEMAPHIKDGSKALAGFVSWFAKNPMSGIGAIIGASVAKDIAAAGIGGAISRGLTAILNANAKVGAVSSVGGAGVSALGVGAAGAAAAGAWWLASDQQSRLERENPGATEAIDNMSLLDQLGLYSEGIVSALGLTDPSKATGDNNSLRSFFAAMNESADEKAIRAAEARTGKSREQISAGFDALDAKRAGKQLTPQQQAALKPDTKALDDALVGAASKAGDALVTKLNAWVPPASGPNRDGSPIVKR